MRDNLSSPGIEPGSRVLQADDLLFEPPGNPNNLSAQSQTIALGYIKELVRNRIPGSTPDLLNQSLHWSNSHSSNSHA